MKELLLIILAYLIGSIPTALIVSKRFFGVDIRDYGSGNMGATNTFRVLGSRYGTLVMAVDILKGMVAVGLYTFIPFYMQNELERTNFMIGLGLAALKGSPIERLVLNDVGPAIEYAALERIGQYLGAPLRWPDEQAAADYLWGISQSFGPHTREQWLALTRPQLRPAPEGGFMSHYDPEIGRAHV